MKFNELDRECGGRESYGDGDGFVWVDDALTKPACTPFSIPYYIYIYISPPPSIFYIFIVIFLTFPLAENLYQ